MKPTSTPAVLYLIPLLLVACAGAPDGIRLTPKGDGPAVVVDWDAKPLPDIPFPNDLATRTDPHSVTGLRVNISKQATTELEAKTRRKIDELTGFGIYAPLSVAFESPLDLDNIVARQQDDGNFTDDVLWVIDVTPGSPTYLQPVDIDIGNGRFPGDVDRQDVYFPNDVAIDVPSVLFDTHDEDINGNGVMDWGEDVDGDGYLDVPNVYPVGGDAREDLLTWYERATNTLIFRPVVPLREETQYAVVLTERLVGEDGKPIRSPWPWVNHTRQTDALLPVIEAVEGLGASVDDIAYAWVFTTARITGDLVDIRRSLDGDGPFDWLPEEIPPAISAADPVHGMPNVDAYQLPVTTLTAVLGLAELVPEESLDRVEAGYAYGESMVGGFFRSPDLLADRDDEPNGDGGDAVDEWWEVDPVAGTLNAKASEIAFTCVIPKETETHQQPFDVAIWGHGYGSSRIEGFSFAWALVELGMAVCVMDYPGHGPTLDDEDRAEMTSLLQPLGLMPFLEHVEKARFVDVDNDGIPDSGAHQWTADAFHTRDNVRQAVVDWMWMVRAFEECGTSEMEKGDKQVMNCDWDEDGVPDIGGPDAEFTIAGGSLGGIVDGVAAAVMPEIAAHVPVVAGGGLMDISTRAPTGGAVEAMHGKLLSPLILGYPNETGGLLIVQHVDSFMDMVDVPIATLDSVPAGGRVTVENVVNGELREIVIPEDGRFRVGIAADALDHYERRIKAGIPETGVVDGQTYTVPSNAGLGDELIISIYDASGARIAELDNFQEEGAVFQGVPYTVGSTLVAAASGLGKVRAAPGTRRTM
ncbi:MAG: hypothetical protein GWP91_16995, partial [Rhodobacterales bacterium]|nr:hypothetical protein [Rhodobacterales bacterium]